MRSRFEQIQIDITTTHSEIHLYNRWCFLYLPHRRLLALPLCLKVARGHHPFRGSFSLLNGNLNLSELQGFMKSLKAYECELSRDSDQRITSHVVSFAKIAFPVLNISLFIKSSVIIQTRVWTRQEGKDCVRTNDFMFYVTIVRIISECDFFFFKPTCLVFRKPKIVYRNANYWWRNYLAK